MTDSPTTPATSTGTLAFIEFNRPPLESGDYSVTIAQTVSYTDTTDTAQSFNETFTTALSFAVAGPRFSLPQGSVIAQFPPPGAEGDFSAVLPHVVLADPTLPWQRDNGYAGDTTSPYIAASGSDPKVYPWLALFTLDAGDPVPTVATGTLADLSTALPAHTVSYPDFTLEYGEAVTDSCQYIDIPAALFAAIAPSAEDMRWLTHVRSTDSTDAKPAGSSGTCAAVVSNRLPTPGSAGTAVLVSLEGMAGYLPGSAGPAAGTIAVRVAVLATWSFTATTGAKTFLQWFEALNQSPSTLQIPYADATKTANPTVSAALAMGYTAINHQTRQGAATVSWYRGPLLPFALPPTVALPAAAADALLRYDPATGMLDVSLAAAWQFGQLAALKDKGFATAFYSWSRRQTAAAVAAFETAQLTGETAEGAGTGDSPPGPAHVQVFTTTIAPALKTYLGGAQ